MTTRTKTALRSAAKHGNPTARSYLFGYLVGLDDIAKGRFMYSATPCPRAWARGYRLALREIGIIIPANIDR